MEVTNCYKYEKIIHNLLKDLRINDSREFFEIEPEDAIEYFYKDYLIENGGDKNDFNEDYLKICEEEYNKDEIKEIIKNEIKNEIKYENKDKNKNNIKDKIKDENIEIIDKKNFECEKCGKDFKYKYLLLKHQNRKFTCETSSNIDTIFDEKIKILENEIENKTKSSPVELKCLFCKKTQTFKNNVYRHVKDFCSVKKKLMYELFELKEKKQKNIK